MDIGTQILLNNALRHIREKDLGKAGDLLMKAQKSSPKNPDVLRFLSVVAAMKFNYCAALELIDQVIALTPDNGIAHSNRGNIFKELGRFDDALISLDKAIALQPNYAEAYNNKGNVLQDLYCYEESLVWYDKAIALQPNYAEAYSNKGNALGVLDRHHEAMKYFDAAVSIDPGYVDAYWHKSLSQLVCGDYSKGWQNYEARWFRANAPSLLYTSINKLGSLEELESKKILIWAEQGFGDTLQFCRYIKPLADLGCRVTFAIPMPLTNVLNSLTTFSTLVEFVDESIVTFDYQSPLLSLPLLFKTTVETIPAKIPYLIANKVKRREFESKLIKSKNLKVGIVWNGGFRPDYPELWRANKRRNIALGQIARLRDVFGVDFYSLQKGNPAEAEFMAKKDEIWPESINCAPWLDDFSDTAALIENLDLVISVDTSTAHLTGALGKPVWILNRYDSCWRWLRGRTDSPWYPSATIYQQTKPGDWDGVIDRVKADLHALALKHATQ